MAAPSALTNSLVKSFFPTSTADVVGVFGQNYSQVFYKARPLKAVIKEEAKLMEHPVETGATITDFRIVLPIEIELILVIQANDYRSEYENIKQLYLNATLLTVQTKTSVYKNQLIASLPHDEDAEIFDAITMALKLKEVQFAVTQIVGTISSPRKPSNSGTVNRGNQQTTDAGTATPGSFLHGAFF